MNIISSAVGWFLSLGSTTIVPIVLILLALVFRVDWRKAIRGGLMVGIGLAGLFLVVNVIIGALQPAVEALATRLGIVKNIVDVDWADAGIAWGWPGVVFVILGVIVVNIVLVLLKAQKTLQTDVWSYWHGSALGGFIWALTGSVVWGVVAAVVYLTVCAWMADLTAKKLQDFNEMPGIGVVCPVWYASLLAIPVVWLVDRIPGLRDWDATPEGIRKRFGILGDNAVLGVILGIIIGIAAGYDVKGILTLAMQVALMMVLLPKMVSIIAEGLIPITQSIVEFMRTRFKGREIHIAVDCAVLVGHPSCMAAAVIMYPLAVLLAAVLPGVQMLPIASLALIPFYAGAIAPYTKGNVIKTVLVLIPLLIPYMYFSTLTADVHTATFARMGMYADQINAGTHLASWDMGGDPLGFIITSIFRLFGFSV